MLLLHSALSPAAPLRAAPGSRGRVAARASPVLANAGTSKAALPAPDALQRLKILYAINVAVPLPLGLTHILAPAAASKWAWLGHTVPHPLLYPLIGSLWAAVGIVSLLGLLSDDPFKFSGITLIQAVYKVIFLGAAIVPPLVARNLSAFPLVPTLVFSSYLPLLALTVPWAYLFPKRLFA